jgi:hypothetical protein
MDRNALKGAQWICHPGNEAAVGTWNFWKKFSLPGGQKLKRAEMIITADNYWKLYINGPLRGISDSDYEAWRSPQVIDVADVLESKDNVIAVEVENVKRSADDGSRAGLLMKLVLEFEGGHDPMVLKTDGSWVSSPAPQTGSQAGASTPKPARQRVRVIGKYGMGPWGMLPAVLPADGSRRSRERNQN